jgi:hypothetical protein
MPQNVSDGFNASIGVSVFFFGRQNLFLRPIQVSGRTRLLPGTLAHALSSSAPQRLAHWP